MKVHGDYRGDYQDRDFDFEGDFEQILIRKLGFDLQVGEGGRVVDVRVREHQNRRVWSREQSNA